MKIRVKWKKISIKQPCRLQVWLAYSEKGWGPFVSNPAREKTLLQVLPPTQASQLPIPPSVSHNDIPFVPLSWLHFCLMLANLQRVPHGLGISILLACGRLCLCQPLSRPPVLFPPQTMHYCHSMYNQRTQQDNPAICWEAVSPGYHLKGCGVRQNKFKCRLSLISRVTLV